MSTRPDERTHCYHMHVAMFFFYVCSDETKKRSTLQKLFTLHKGLGNCAEVVSCCSRLLATYEASNQSDAKTLAELWLDITSYLLAEKSLSEDAWEMVSRY